MGKARGLARHFRAGLETMMREAELEELEKQWREQNEAIMREFPRIDGPDAVAASTPVQAGAAEAEPKPLDKPSEPEKPETHDVPPRDGPLP